jgi:hypothetical protein
MLAVWESAERAPRVSAWQKIEVSSTRRPSSRSGRLTPTANRDEPHLASARRPGSHGASRPTRSDTPLSRASQISLNRNNQRFQ